MPCDDCNKKKKGVIVNDNWKAGSSSRAAGGAGKTNQVLAGLKTARTSPYGAGGGKRECKSCQKSLLNDGKYCANCANKKGRCSICGKKIHDMTGVGEISAGFNKR